MKEVRMMAWIAIGIATGCSGEAADGRNPTGSQAMAVSHDFGALYVASPDEGVVGRIDVDANFLRELEVGGEPTRIARIGERVLVTLRAERAVLELVDDGIGLEPVRRVEVGAEPVGIVATRDGSRLFVAVSQARQVLELDPPSLRPIRAWNIPDEPKWLAIHPSNRTLYVGATGIGGLFTIDVQSGASEAVELPPLFGQLSDETKTQLIGRVTGDLATSPRGDFLAVPMLYVDRITPIEEGRVDTIRPRQHNGYGNGGGVGRMNPVIAMFRTDGDGRLGAPTLLLMGDPGALSYPASATFSPNGDHVFATFEGSDRIVVFRTEDEDKPSSNDIGHRTFDALEVRTLTTYRAPAGPRAIAFTANDVGFVYGFLDREVVSFGETVVPARSPLNARVEDLPLLRRVSMRAGALPVEVEEGRRWFWSATNFQISGGGVTCASCHPDGRTDGMTWVFDRGPRQTPSLAGMVSLLEPVRWQADRATVVDDVLATSKTMGGIGLPRRAAERVAAYVDFTRPVDHPMRGVSTHQVELGREIFNRPEVGCATCHAGALYTDKKTYSMNGFNGVKTPSLLGVAATAPYFHDGSAPDLMSVLDRARTDLMMGDTSMLDDTEMKALEAFLLSL